ncbi:hypothetical protein H2198_004119 [Neophaeococcomyces mojaviensis]|uniref:Uncharacterized protein n=1 Tax=Neophaeococcomyces mojaviensis TaxID=3383035 RepID=A0ACC3A9D4_9EURO|nr:hypothetical protein H2198_004119 [Knufia sp. JES_112]
MRNMLSLPATTALLLLAASPAHGLLPLAARSEVPLPPSTDPFYQPPLNFDAVSPGGILRNRTLTFISPYVNATNATAHQFLYRTTDSNNLPAVALTTLLVPFNAQPNKLLSFQFAYDSASVDCSPSYNLYVPTNDHAEAAVLTQALAEGIPVSYPDYEGPTAAFTNGVQSGQAVLDSIKAIISSNIPPFDSKNADISVVLAGASGGALASNFALELLSSYAPSLTSHIVGALLTAMVPNVTSIYYTITGTPNAGLIPSSFLGLAKQNLAFASYLSHHLVPSSAQSFLAAGTRCVFPNLAAYANVSIESYFDVPDFVNQPVPASVIHNVTEWGAHGTPKVPIFAYKGIADELSPVADSDKLIKQYCNAGANINYVRAIGANHGDAAFLGFTAGWEWLMDRLDRKLVQGGCSTQNVTATATSRL